MAELHRVRATMVCLIAPLLSPPSARHRRGRDKSGPYAPLQQLFHTPPLLAAARGQSHENTWNAKLKVDASRLS